MSKVTFSIRIMLVTALVAFVACTEALAQQYYWSNLAGMPGGSGTLDGTGSAAQFCNPRSVVVDGSGNVYVADHSNHTIRKVTASGVVTTFAGKAGVSGTSDGVGNTSRFNNPSGIAVDGSGTLYVADTGNYTIRKVTSDGTVTTLAGSPGQYGVTDGMGSAALFGCPSSVAVDSGHVYVADSASHTIRKVTAAGVVTTFAGTAGQLGTTDGIGSAARFNQPNGVAVDGSGNVYVADTFNHTIRIISDGGAVTTLAGNPILAGIVDGTGALAMFNFPHSLTVDGSGNVYVADSFNHTIRKVTHAGVVTTLAGSAGVPGFSNGIGNAAQFSTPCGLSVDGSGYVYVADTFNHCIRKVTADWGVVTTFVGSVCQSGTANGTGNAARFRFPNGVGVDPSGNLYVADTNTHTIRKVTSAGVVSTLVGTSATFGGLKDGTWAALFNNPYGIAVTSSSNMYIADTFNNIIRQVYPSGGWRAKTIGGLVMTNAKSGLSGGMPGRADGTGTSAQFSNPSGVAADSSGTLYITDTYNHTIRQMTRSGTTWTVTTLTGSSGLSGTSNGIGSAARFSSPFGVAVDSGSNVYVGDYANHTIRKMTVSGTLWTVATLAGSPGVSGTSDGVGSDARFNNPAGLAVDSGSNVYVADSGNNTIRKVKPDGTVTTIGGMPGVASGADGVGNAAMFNTPCGVVVSSSGIIYVADSGNNRISVGSCAGSGTASLVSGTGATLNGFAFPNGVSTTIKFQYGTSTNYTSTTPVQDIGSGTDFLPVSAALTGLTANATYHYRLVVINAKGTFYGIDQVFITPPVSVPYISSAVAITGTKGLALNNYQIVASNSATGFGASGLPGGLAINAATGIISGTPTASGAFPVTLSATNIVGSGTKTLTISVVDMALPSFTSETTASGIVGAQLVYTIAATPYVTSYNATGLPAGVDVDTVTGVISGAPRVSGTFAVTLSAGNISGTSTTTLTFTVSPAYYWSNFAGQPGVSGSTDGIGNSARFWSPQGIARDSSGNLYVADNNNQTIRKVTPEGVVTTLAGKPNVAGSADGPGSTARFRYPSGMAVDGANNVYVADSSNHSIRKLTVSGTIWTVTTFAGLSGVSGTADGIGNAARFNSPKGIAVDSGSNFYVTDSNNFTIRKITPAGVVTTFAGTAGSSGGTDGTGSAALFGIPLGIAVDSSSNVYVADGRNSIRKITPTGVVTTLAGTYNSAGSKDGIGAAAQFNNPFGIVVDSGGSLYVADEYNSTIRKIVLSGTNWTVTTIGGTPAVTGRTDGAGSAGRFCYPFGVAVNSAGIVYVADGFNNRIVIGASQLPPGITSALTTSGTAGTAFRYAITGSNSPTSYNAVGLPAGLAIDTATGLISGTPTVSGSFSLPISATNLGGPTTNALSLIIWNSQAAWKSLKFTSVELANSAISGDTAAPAGDGISNLMKYALSLDPKSAAITGLPKKGVTTVSGTDYLTLTYTPTPWVSDITYTVEVTGDLRTWHSGPGFTSLVGTGTASNVTVQDTTPMSSASKRFIRLNVTKP